MGVHGLWELLAPVGRRVSVETLAGKRLAIDASIWMVQFIKAMRDEKGEMVHNAHLLGFFRRICKLLFLRTKPVFVFDGATPALKRRTLASRRRHRDAARAKIRKTAEKLLLSHLKARKLEELAAELKKSSERKEDAKGKKVESANTANHEKLDELLAASLAAEDEMNGAVGASTSADFEEEKEDDDEEEMIIPLTGDNIDPAVLASLPPSMQLDLLVQMRERMMAENRHKFQKIKKSPAKFSELQIQSYLKTVAFRREIDQVQRCAAGKDLGGLQTSKIASETNREYIFSSSFTGDKQMLAQQVGNDANTDSNIVKKHTISDPSILSAATSSRSAKEAPMNELQSDYTSEVETYKDERGRVRVNRLRGLGIRMTRDIQRNLDFIKEYEQESNMVGDSPSEKDGPSVETNDLSSDISFPRSDLMEISFLEDPEESKDSIDDIFLSLAAGVSSNKEPVVSDGSEGMWEDGVVEETGVSGIERDGQKNNDVVWVENNSEGDDVDWEDGVSEIPVTHSKSRSEQCKVSKGVLEEEALVQEAIRRSLEESFGKETRIAKGNHKIDNSMSEVNDKVDWEEGTSYSPIKSTSSQPEEEDSLMQEAIKRSLEDLPREKSYSEMPAHLDTVKPGEISRSLGIGTSLDPIESRGSGYGEGRHSEENVVEGVFVNGKLSETNIEELKGNVDDSKSDELESSDKLSPESEKKQLADAIGDIKGPSASTDLGPISERGLDQFNRSSALNQLDRSSKDHVTTSDLGFIPGTGVHQLDRSSDMNKSFGDSIGDKESTGINVVSDMARGDDAGLSNLIVEDTADEDFMDDLNTISEANLQEEISLLKQEQAELGHQRRKLESHAEAVSNEMYAECQELLQMFGLPYIIAPTEAEAQCAFMEMNNLVDGVVTDDSDVFLFGAQSVYKNIFDDRKYVETYFMKDIEAELGLNREKLIRMAMLLGSDYTEGVSGIGIVNAIEVVHAFPEEDGLKEFREWVESPDPSILENFDLGLKKKSSKAETNNGETKEGKDGKSPTTNSKDIKVTFMDNHRNISKNWHLPSSFPSQAVVDAYYSPHVDNSTEKFSWGKPDLNLLRKLCWERLGWNQQKADELLLPVLKEYSKHETQLRLEAFYTFNERFAKIRSQRIKKAIKGITGSAFPDIDDPVQEKNLDKGESSHGRKTRKKGSNTSQKGRARKRKSTAVQQEKSDPDTSSEVSDKNESQFGTTEEMTQIRRSKRQRNHVKYTEDDNEVSDPDNRTTNQSEANVVDQGAVEENPSFTDIECTETVEAEDTETVANSTEASTKEYLYSGGGFCTDEGDENMDPATDEPVEGVNEAQDVSTSPSTGTKEDMTNTTTAETEKSVSRDANPDLPIEGKVKWGLTAMPSLKRRKS
ncbi:5'-3' exonuclease family protein [Rhynchospora pubera]|uniref:5'-3' exonuclease family protein n=1 Tax=Rhynchospora pubera TaxID=906938 RepID=A0AAV8DZU0_9POAL|nr:5'-3' exonuclease family protein [Rhynchospora pubera]